MKQIRTFLIGVACLMSLVASAQWQWIDKDGRKVFSDRAPPADVLDKNILKRPAGRGSAAGAGKVATNSDGAAPATEAAASGPQGAASAPRLSGIDKELAEKKKKAAEAEVARRKAEEERVLAAKVENCARARQAKASFDSGRRISRPNEKGEPQVLDAAARASEVKRIQSIIESDCD